MFDILKTMKQIFILFLFPNLKNNSLFDSKECLKTRNAIQNQFID